LGIKESVMYFMKIFYGIKEGEIFIWHEMTRPHGGGGKEMKLFYNPC